LDDDNIDGNRQPIRSLSVVGQICKKLWRPEVGHLAHTKVVQRSSFYYLPSVRKATALVTAHTKFRVTDRVSVGGNVGAKEPKSDAKIKLGETGRASTAWRSESSTIGIEDSFGQT